MMGVFSLSFSYSVVSDSLQPHGWQHNRLLWPSLSPSVSQTHVHWPSPAIQPSYPLPSTSSPALSLSHQVAKVLALQLKHQSFQWIFRTDFLSDWLVWSSCPRDSQESSATPQFKSINSLALSFFIGQLSHPYMTTGKTIALTRWTFVGKIVPLLFNMLSKLVIAFLPRSKHLLISMAAVPICSDFGAQEKKACHCFHCFPIYLPWSDGTRCHEFSFLNVEF